MEQTPPADTSPHALVARRLAGSGINHSTLGEGKLPY